MKFDRRELDHLVKALRGTRSLRWQEWMPRTSKAAHVVEAVVMACLAAYFLVGIVGVLAF
jgi:hypothetical protein